MPLTSNQKAADKFIRSESAKYARESKRLLSEAAPDLLAACKARLAEWHADERNFERKEPQSVKLARAAIRKAQGD